MVKVCFCVLSHLFRFLPQRLGDLLRRRQRWCGVTVFSSGISSHTSSVFKHEEQQKPNLSANQFLRRRQCLFSWRPLSRPLLILSLVSSSLSSWCWSHIKLVHLLLGGSVTPERPRCGKENKQKEELLEVARCRCIRTPSSLRLLSGSHSSLLSGWELCRVSDHLGSFLRRQQR